MKRKPFQKTLLALMVSAGAAQASAVEFDVSTGQNAWSYQTFNETVTLVGTRNIVATERKTDGASVADTNIQGALINYANFNLDGSGRNVRGFVVDGALDSDLRNRGGTITGGIVQAGTINMVNQIWAEGFEVGAAMVGGNVVNTGTIIAVDVPGSGPESDAEGIYLNGTTVAGDVINSGLVDITSYYGYGLILDTHNNIPVTVGGKIINAGIIRVTGEEALGMVIETETNPLRIENTGLLSVTGNQSRAVEIYEGTVDNLLNTGTIEAKGSNASAISLRGATFTNDSPVGARGIINRGVISADSTAILVKPVDQTSPFEINQQAGEIRSSSGVAIDGGNLASLIWTGGRIQGDVLGVNSVNIGGQADFTGSRINAPVSVNAGSLNLSAPGTVMSRELYVGSGAGVDMRLGSQVVPTTPYLTVNGPATFALGSHITVSAKPGDFTSTPAATQYILLQAGSLQNNGLTVASASSLLNVLSYSADAQTVKAVVSVKSDQQVRSMLASVGTAEPTVAAVNTLKNRVLSQLDTQDAVFQSVANAPSVQALAQVGEALKPDVNRGALDVALSGQSVVNGAIFNRLTDQRESRQTGGVWVQGLSSNMDQDGRGGNNGYSANSSGMAVGVDGRLNDTTTLGVAYSYLNSNIHSDLGNKTEVEGHALSLYGNWALQNWFVDGSLSYGHNDNDSKRHVAGTTAKGSYDSNVLAASVIGGYSFKPSQAVVIEPRVAARYANVRMDGFDEKGSAAALSTRSQRYEVGELGAGVRLAGNLPMGAGSLQPEATLMAYHDLMGDRVAQTSNFVAGGAAFTTTGASVARDSYEASVGVNYQVSDFTVGASYTRQARSGFDADGVMLKARYAF
ncbi:autotransporter outer membrane beta-barrel domain-containing protein [Pseudomonas sp. KBS0710]|uniref:autotransporter family protein n=1 Tax=Pseudomonas sp. KBS0710 TaxID=1179667 RepID=UPI00110E6A01|nr:autotransporter outer membrane beta-barrel domain-containing protein [Pseudomonas sp. KBS0710]TSD79703.1 autotransporter outer membrane beta-barrel domain-containing protein [Pseudomonas sp. KBS0710]